MALKGSARHLAEALVQAGQYGQARLLGQAGETSDRSAAPAFTIALSREVGAGGTSVASEVGARLGWPVYDRSLLERVAREMNLRVKLLESIDEKRVSWIEEVAEGFASGPLVSESRYVRHLIETILSLGTHGHCVIVGRGAPQILPPATTLRVRLVASLEDRITVMSRELNVSRAEAARHVEATQRERVRFIKDHFQKDPTDPEHYDLVLNSSRFTTVECADLVIEALRRLQGRAAGAGRR